jgi:hypothetical protein
MYVLLLYSTSIFILETPKDLRQKILELQRQNERSKLQYKELFGRVNTMSIEIRNLKEENQSLLAINKALGDENDQLNGELEKYRKFRYPKNVEGDSATRPAKRRKGKTPCTDEEEDDDMVDDARVCKLLINFYYLYIMF